MFTYAGETVSRAAEGLKGGNHSPASGARYFHHCGWQGPLHAGKAGPQDLVVVELPAFATDAVYLGDGANGGEGDDKGLGRALELVVAPYAGAVSPIL